MKIKKLILSVIICVLYFSVNAQEKENKFTESLKGVNVVVLNLCENTTIKTSQLDEIKVMSYLFTKGDTWGWQYPKERPLFKPEIKQSNDTLFVRTPTVFKPKSIGVNIYEEKIETSIQVPGDKQIIIKKADNLIIEDEFILVDIYNTNELNYQLIKKSKVKMLLCEANKELIINGKQKGNNYEFQGTGKGKYILKANKITVTIK